jgi:AcrR family transcriptional regulator
LSKQSKTSHYTKNATSKRKRGDAKAAFAGTQRRTRQSAGIRQQILRATEKRLITSGYHTLSMRKIASECNISVGNLTYHYPTKELLITSMVNHTLDFYMEQSISLLSTEQSPSNLRVESLFEWLFTDANNEKSARLFRELWTLSSHYPKVHKKMADFYKRLISFYVQYLSQEYPSKSHHELETIICLLAILTEGTGVVYGGRYGLPIKFKEIISIIMKIVAEYIEA